MFILKKDHVKCFIIFLAAVVEEQEEELWHFVRAGWV